MTDDLFSKKNDLLSILGPVSLTDKDPNDFTVVVEGQALRVQAGRVKRAIDTVADGWTASLKWVPDNPDMAQLLRPFGYQISECYLGTEVAVNGLLYNIKNKFSSGAIVKELEGFSLTADIIDVNVKPPFEQAKVTLEERARALTEPFGFKIKWDVKSDEPFDRVTANPNDKIYAHLLSLARQRGVLITSTPLGELLFTTANINGSPVDTLTEDFPPGLDFAIAFNGRARFHEYQSRAQTPGRKKRSKSKLKVASAFDPIVPEYRFTTSQADDSTMGNIQRAADWQRSKTIAQALTIPYPVSSWYDKNGKLWQENTIVTLKSEALHIPDGYNFLIRAVEYVFDSQNTPAILSLVPPQVYSGEEIKEPWGIPTAGFLEGLI